MQNTSNKPGAVTNLWSLSLTSSFSPWMQDLQSQLEKTEGQSSAMYPMLVGMGNRACLWGWGAVMLPFYSDPIFFAEGMSRATYSPMPLGNMLHWSPSFPNGHLLAGYLSLTYPGNETLERNANHTTDESSLSKMRGFVGLKPDKDHRLQGILVSSRSEAPLKTPTAKVHLYV